VRIPTNGGLAARAGIGMTETNNSWISMTQQYFNYCTCSFIKAPRPWDSEWNTPT